MADKKFQAYEVLLFNKKKILNNNKVIRNRLDNYLIPFKNGCLTHVNPKLYIKCPLEWQNNQVYNVEMQLTMELWCF
jgi:hypothetical protein